MRILVVQTTRMGDVIQTSPLIRALKRKYPGAHITAMVRKMGETIAARNPDVDAVLVHEEDDMYLDVGAEDSDRLLHAYETADAFVRTLREGRFDLAVNCTHSLASAMLMKLAGIPRVIGAHLSEEWQYLLRGRGPNYFITSVLHREYNDLNLCDLFRLFLDTPPPSQELVFDVTEDDRAAARALLRQHGVGDDDFVACFQLGASDTHKRWPETHFAALGKELARRHNARVVLVGVENEAPLGRAFEQLAPGLGVQLFGKTTIPELAAVLERANVLVTNDTGTMHLASAVGCPVVLVSVGYVHFRETGPYGAGHCAVELRRDSVGRSDIMHSAPDDRHRVTPDHVLPAVDAVLSWQPGEPVPGLPSTPELDAVEIHFSEFAPDGFLQWYPLVQRPASHTDVLRLAYRAMWLRFLTGERSEEDETAALRHALVRYEPQPGAAEVLAAPFSELVALAEKGARVTEELLHLLREKGSMKKAAVRVHDLVELDEEIRLFGEVHEECRPLAVVARFERDNLEGSEPLVLAATTARIYADLRERAALTAEKLTRIAAIWREILR